VLDDLTNPTRLQFNIKQSKTDPFQKGASLYIHVGRTGLRGCQPGPLFLFQSRKPLMRPHFVMVVREALGKSCLEERKYCSHCFRIGAATTAASRGMEDCIIKTLGHWRECGVPVICQHTMRATDLHLGLPRDPSGIVLYLIIAPCTPWYCIYLGQCTCLAQGGCLERREGAWWVHGMLHMSP